LAAIKNSSNAKKTKHLKFQKYNHMNYNIKSCILSILLTLAGLTLCFELLSQAQPNYLTAKLLKADNSQDTNLLKSIFAENIIILYPDAPPFYGKEVAVELHEFIWNSNVETSIDYLVDNAERSDTGGIETGRYIFIKKDGTWDTITFKADLVKENGSYFIERLSYGNTRLEDKVIRLPLTTGKYQVGRFTFLNNKDKRPMAFQIWYPASYVSGKPLEHQSMEVTKASSEFLGLPMLWMSYFSLIETNSFLNAEVVSGSEFPVLLYNHGYGGFTSVYQTVFEELASHGYIVVSIGHKDESALLISEDGNVIPNNSDNPFYTKRQSELNGAEINQLQSVILNSDDIEENKQAYEKLIELSPLHKESVELWAMDTKAVVEQLKYLNSTHDKLKGTFDFDNIGVFGHSVGGATAGQLAYNYDEIKAAINLDGFQFGDLINNKLNAPTMFIAGNHTGTTYLRSLVFMENTNEECYQVSISGFSHDNFTDLKYILEGDSNMIILQRDLIRLFFDKYLKNSDVDIKDIEQKYPVIKVRANY
jgi:pimeloyl-ACP methyl ester carboxylesterase